MDLAAVAHLSAISSKYAFMHCFDGFRTSHEMQRIEALDYEDLRGLVDYESLKEFRRHALNPEHPTNRGNNVNPDVYFQCKEGANEKSAALPDRVQHYMLVENADEPYAAEISKAIVNRIKRGGEVSTTTQLRELIEETLIFLPAGERKETVKKSCQRTFQALRIDVNSEFEALGAFLEKLPNVLASGARVAILTFHSGEDRLVKQSFKQLLQDGVYCEIATDIIRPTAEECGRNSRARSAKMRWAIKA